MIFHFYFVADLWALIQQFYQNVCRKGRKLSKNLFEYIISVYGEYGDDTDNEDEEEMSQEVLAGWESKDSPDYAADTP